ncbi:MAG: WecB/TagA/CpsF family glycosyltransferase [Bacteroidales bacterium]|jgi:N-acetylglucosaminyldiphosphoundecaprenol N-acetyl-beta-D-mannosaminyltransferase
MKTDFLGIPVDSLTMEETLDRIDLAIRENKRIRQVSINAGKVVLIQHDKELYNSVVSCDIISPDGQSIIWASRFLGKYLPCRVAGCDLMQELVNLAYKNKYKCFFFGATEAVIKRVVDIYKHLYGTDIIAGYRNGYFKKTEGPLIAKQIVDSGAQILFVAITSPKKENFLCENADILKKVNYTMGVGGTFDIIAGVTKRAPKWMQNYGLEWFYRFLLEPRRMWRRYLVGNSKFIYLVFREKFRTILN